MGTDREKTENSERRQRGNRAREDRVGSLEREKTEMGTELEKTEREQSERRQSGK